MTRSISATYPAKYNCYCGLTPGMWLWLSCYGCQFGELSVFYSI